MDPSSFNIEDLIPQRPPMVMIDHLVHAEEKSAGGRLTVRESNLFCLNGYLQESGMIEFIAQTAAAWTGFKQLSAGKEVMLGFIGSVKNLVVYSMPAVDTTIESEIVLDSEVLGYSIIIGRVLQKGKLLAECEMRIKLENK
ncbi:MAG: hydroxymyristoyl-ACP dehydratase [Bacteroidia bacterium]|nr:hydroxymyristoyl-ACP dehydratase [Bacteroidia bacterium]